MSELLPGDGKLHIHEEDFFSLVEQVLIAGRELVDGHGLKVFVRLDPERAKTMAFDMLSQLTSEAGKSQPHYDLVLGGIE